ncbi:Uu.00g023500.m01.CDS01 [Anthostomella pinea]|uniref:Uu.00g023500.m01.CDS01 n=1 Tax=Anthostomella pinea TaxID=933095 RepID=A0AAI8VU75_9PEZI|nr:Uu.00g023500.m01.CDS01 [Anthostomella pinea]
MSEAPLGQESLSSDPSYYESTIIMAEFQAMLLSCFMKLRKQDKSIWKGCKVVAKRAKDDQRTPMIIIYSKEVPTDKVKTWVLNELENQLMNYPKKRAKSTPIVLGWDWKAYGEELGEQVMKNSACKGQFDLGRKIDEPKKDGGFQAVSATNLAALKFLNIIDDLWGALKGERCRSENQ